jgi:hypothetical protein
MARDQNMVEVEDQEELEIQTPTSTLKEDVDVIVMLDTDIIVANDFSKFLSTEKILIKPEDRKVISISDWQLLFDFFQIELPIRNRKHISIFRFD